MPKHYNDGATVLLPAKTWIAVGFQINLLQGSAVVAHVIHTILCEAWCFVT